MGLVPSIIDNKVHKLAKYEISPLSISSDAFTASIFYMFTFNGIANKRRLFIDVAKLDAEKTSYAVVYPSNEIDVFVYTPNTSFSEWEISKFMSPGGLASFVEDNPKFFKGPIVFSEFHSWQKQFQ